jgi:4-amino-4-deoxy-L-arabinose transferase-like glycosyltransferase
MRSKSTLMLHMVLLAALCGVLYFAYLGSTPFFDKGEPREALAVQDIVQRKENVRPNLPRTCRPRC